MQNGTLQASLNRVNLENEAKDAKIKSLEHSVKTSISSAQPTASVHFQKLPPAVVEDSQPRSIDEVLEGRDPSSDTDDALDPAYDKKYRGLFAPDTPPGQNNKPDQSQASQTDRRALSRRSQSLSQNGFGSQERIPQSPFKNEQPSFVSNRGSQSSLTVSATKTAKSIISVKRSLTQQSGTPHSSFVDARGSKRDAIAAEFGQLQSSQARKSRRATEMSTLGPVTNSPARSRGVRGGHGPPHKLPAQAGKKSSKGVSSRISIGTFTKEKLEIARSTLDSMRSPDVDELA